MSHRASAGLLLALLLSLPAAAPAARPDPSLESLLVALDLERKARVDDVLDVDRLTLSLTRADGVAAVARQRLLDFLHASDADAADLREQEEHVVEAEAKARAAQETRRVAVTRLLERTRRIALLQEEIAKRRLASRRPADPVTGRWQTIIDPGGRKGSSASSWTGRS
ncbi:secreted protein, partial [sediment metagenome]